MTTAASHRARGAAWEKAVAEYVGGYRDRLHGARDTGDVIGLPGVVVECKAQGRYELLQWIYQVQAEGDRAGAGLGLVAVKAKGHTQPSKGIWLVDPRHVPYLVELVRRDQ